MSGTHAPPARFSERSVDVAIGAALFVGTLVLMALTSDAVGFTRDEGYYFRAGETYFGWFRELWQGLLRGEPGHAFQQALIDRHLSYNYEHPVLLKNLFALSFGLGHEVLGVFEKSSTAFRFPAWCFSALSVALVFGLGRTLLPRRAALLAALAWLSMPRVFWHMHLACFDIGVCAAHLWLVWAYIKGQGSLRGALGIGVAFGLAAAVKHNVLIAPAFFVLHWLLVEASLPRRDAAGIHLPPIPLPFLAMAFVGPLVFVLHWPYLWPDVVARVGRYLAFHLQHEHYPILYFHDLLTQPPFPLAFPFVMSALTIPVPLLVMMVVGIALGVRALWARWRHRHAGDLAPVTLVPLGQDSASTALLLGLQALFPFLLIAMPSSPIFGGTKHWMNALPFLCILGAWALEEGVARLRVARPAARALFAILAVGVLVPGFWLSARVHPYGLSSYNALAGFARGAANLGMQRTFWGYEPREVLDEINERTPTRGRIHFGDTNHDDWRFYRRDRMLRDDIAFSQRVSGAHVAAVQPQGEFKEQWMDVLNTWAIEGPDRVVHLEGVPLLTLTFSP